MCLSADAWALQPSGFQHHMEVTAFMLPKLIFLALPSKEA